MATPLKKPAPKVKITGSASGRAATGTKSVTRGASMAQSPKIVDSKPAAKVTKVAKGPTIAGPAPKISILKGKVDRAIIAKKGASGNLMLVKEAKKLGNLQGPGSAARRLKQAVQSDLEAGKTAARGKIQLMNAKKSKKAGK
jgi:hypothetical protein